MLIAQGPERNDRIDLYLACWLAAVAGCLNAAAFYAVGFFSANMTGNVSALSNEIAFGKWTMGLFYLAIVSSFVSGATVSTLLINAGRRRKMKAIFAYSILTEAALLILLGVADLTISGSLRIPVLVIGLAFLMGLQNAVVTRISDARVRTTHVSGMATDFGIELGIALDIRRGLETMSDAAHNLAKLRLHVYTIAAFLIGGVVGVIAYRAIDGWLLMVVAAVLVAIAGWGISRARREYPNLPNDIDSPIFPTVLSDRQIPPLPARPEE